VKVISKEQRRYTGQNPTKAIFYKRINVVCTVAVGMVESIQGIFGIINYSLKNSIGYDQVMLKVQYIIVEMLIIEGVL
jgi:hypothetical protein